MHMSINIFIVCILYTFAYFMCVIGQCFCHHCIWIIVFYLFFKQIGKVIILHYIMHIPFGLFPKRFLNTHISACKYNPAESMVSKSATNGRVELKKHLSVAWADLSLECI